MTGIPLDGGQPLCTTCGRKFSNITGLKNHSKVHQRPDPACDICGQIFPTICNSNARHQMHEHKKSCVKKQEKKCPNCGLYFGNKRQRERHSRRCGPQDFKCDKCRRSFNSFNWIKRHKCPQTKTHQ